MSDHTDEREAGTTVEMLYKRNLNQGGHDWGKIKFATKKSIFFNITPVRTVVAADEV